MTLRFLGSPVFATRFVFSSSTTPSRINVLKIQSFDMAISSEQQKDLPQLAETQQQQAVAPDAASSSESAPTQDWAARKRAEDAEAEEQMR